MPYFRVSPAVPALQAYRDQQVLQQLDDLLGVPHYITMGGDGTLLQTLQEQKGEHRTPVIPLNYGTRGYLTNRSMDPVEFVERVKAEGLNYHEFPGLMLDAPEEHHPEKLKLNAFNEFAIQSLGGQSAKLRVLVNGISLSDEPIIATGICVATPQGSTGYSFSAGGPAVVPGVDCMVITFICPYHPRFSPMVVPWDSVIEVEVVDKQWRQVAIVYDGMTIQDDRSVYWIRYSKNYRTVAYLSSHDFTHRMIAKIIR